MLFETLPDENSDPNKGFNADDLTGLDYDTVAKKLAKVEENIKSTREGISRSRVNGAYKNFQSQLKTLSDLMIQKANLDGYMSVIDHSRRKNEAYKASFTEANTFTESLDSVASRIKELEEKLSSF